MTGPELKALSDKKADGDDTINPYLLAYALATEIATTGKNNKKTVAAIMQRDGGCHLYSAWNDKLWDQQAKAEGVSRQLVAVQEGAFDRHLAICAALIPVIQK